MDVNAEDQWKYNLRDRILAAPDNDDNEEAKKMIARLLELPSEDPASDEAFDALMENGAYCFGDEFERGYDIELGRQVGFTYTNLTPDSMLPIRDPKKHEKLAYADRVCTRDLENIS